MSSLTLPTELYRPVVESVGDTATLLSLLLASRTLSGEAERILYDSVDLGLKTPPAVDIRFYETVASCHRLARLLRCLSIAKERYQLVRFDEYYPRMYAALSAAVNLAELVVDLPDLNMSVLSLFAFQLRRFSQSFWFGEAAVAAGKAHDYTAFFANQPFLETLEMYADVTYIHPQPQLFPATVLPNVTAVIGNTAIVLDLLPGRKIKRVHCFFSPSDPALPPFSHSLTDSLQYIRSFSMYRYHASLSRFTEHLTGIQFLELFSDLEMDLQPLYRLSSLRGLSVSSTVIGLTPPDNCIDVIKPFFTGLPNLRFIEVLTFSSEVNEGRCWVWQRKSLESPPIRLPTQTRFPKND